MAPCKSTAEEVSFEWSYHLILLPDSKFALLAPGYWTVLLSCPDFAMPHLPETRLILVQGTTQ